SNYRTGIINEIAQKGYILGNIEESFPAERLTQPDKFVSLLFYYGMLTFTDTFGARMKLGIPNLNVRKQYYDYLLEEYQSIRPMDFRELTDSFDEAALYGNWRPMLDYIARNYSETTSVRSLIEGERNLQGFMNALMNLNPYYLTAPEVELNHGYCDFFLMPDLMRYPMVEHSYILELKYLKADATEAAAEQQWAEAVDQIRHYAEGRVVKRLIQHTRLHPIVVQVRGYEVQRMEEITD
ncbi:MAG: PD-(D/E)XK nuclease domain-containing protein, partial [Prevotella sp.]|nr:PD-(D/E)XK nuclease domain-containing protein [Prevotella sp.]